MLAGPGTTAGLVELTAQLSGETVTIPERSIRTVVSVSETRWSRAAGVLAARLKDAVDLDSVRTDLAALVQRTLEPAHVSVWIRSAGEDLASADRNPVAALLTVVGEPGAEQGWPRGQDPALDQGQRGAVLARQAEPLGEHSPVAAASP
jgi:hypothetical protein